MRWTQGLQRLGLVLAALFVAVAVTFVVGEAFADPGGWLAVLITVAVITPLAALTFLAARNASVASTVLTVAVGLSLVVEFVLMAVGARGPAIAIIAMILVLPLAVIGQHVARRAGALLLLTAVAPIIEIVVRFAREPGADRPPIGALLRGSTGVVVVPIIVLAVLFLAASGTRGAAPSAEDDGFTADPAHPAPSATATDR